MLLDWETPHRMCGQLFDRNHVYVIISSSRVLYNTYNEIRDLMGKRTKVCVIPYIKLHGGMIDLGASLIYCSVPRKLDEKKRALFMQFIIEKYLQEGVSI